MKPKLKLGLTLFALGFPGVLTVLTIQLPEGAMPDEFAEFSPIVIKLLTLLNPTIFLLVAVLVGTLLFDKVNFTVPVISSLLKIERERIQPIFIQQLKYGVSLGLLSGIGIVITAFVFEKLTPHEFEALESGMKLTLWALFLYGGITEELLLRFGFMTLLVWVMFKITKKLNNPIYWIAIILSTLLFAVGHFPVEFVAIHQPSALLLTYIMIGNSIGGLIFGWLYWKKGLEAAIIAHAFAHVAMVSIGAFL
jgi:membrane protease YdiL (CAAX protease family)